MVVLSSNSNAAQINLDFEGYKEKWKNVQVSLAVGTFFVFFCMFFSTFLRCFYTFFMNKNRQ